MTGPVVAAVFAEVLADWRRDGYLPDCDPVRPRVDGDGLSGPQAVVEPGGSGR